MTDYYTVTTAAPTREDAVELARGAVEGRFAAGAQILGPIISAFWHEEKFGQGEEWQLILKTTKARYPALEAHLIARHPWRNPEISATVITGPGEYLTWIDTATS